ncbi:unnamed protein product [Timema podura]|uniref:Uncharacterized protein n=1 Tax=Timema podura TaxID=61482 RepID=A0ABN7PKY5_TIMPD|nr:unnamed protein product [Timema podura]
MRFNLNLLPKLTLLDPPILLSRGLGTM